MNEVTKFQLFCNGWLEVRHNGLLDLSGQNDQSLDIAKVVLILTFLMQILLFSMKVYLLFKKKLL